MKTKRKTTNPYLLRLRKLANTTLFNRTYLFFSLLVLTLTTIYWSLLSAKIQLSNSDQLVYSFLFKNLKTLNNATLPGTHSFLIKWPLFYLINLFGGSNAVINIFTVLLVLVTVGLLTALLYKIDKRPIVFGTICLALASVLLLVPANPYPGAILPVNMAMMNTRNIEYIFLIAGLALLIRKPHIKSLGFWLSALVLSLLFASDKLFLVLAIGSGLLALIIYAHQRQWSLVNLSIDWLVVGVISAVGAYLILIIISHSGLVHLTSVGSSSPYNLTDSAKNFALGVIYGVMGIFTNFGANPAYKAPTLRTIPHQLFSNLSTLSGPAYIVNLLILLAGLFIAYKLIRSTLGKHASKLHFSQSYKLAIILIWASAIAFISYVITNHYYLVDARYLTIVLFAVFIAFASYSRAKKWPPERYVIGGAVICIGIVFGLFGAMNNYNQDKNALAVTNNHNTQVAEALAQHHTTVLIGDYWRVVPIKQVAGNLKVGIRNSSSGIKLSQNVLANKSLNIEPLANCLTPLQTLSSSSWQPNLNRVKFAYLLTISGSLTNYPNCTLNQIVQAYGRPNSSTLIAGTFSHPTELLLYYDKGKYNSAPATPEPSNGPSTVLPISLNELPNTSCLNPTVVTVVAHEDDDTLFMNPDLYNEIEAGDCVRTIYVTAGNAGIISDFYWLSREEGAEAAYSYMTGNNDVWVQRIVELAPNEYVTIANPKSDGKVSLIFMHLPDGNLKGQGFSTSDYESLAKLESGAIKVINSVDGQSYYTSSQLISALATLVSIYQPSLINTQSGVVGTTYPDHSDHLSVNWFTNQAYKQFETEKYDNQVSIPIKYYIGYPIHEMTANLTAAEVKGKQAIFMTYAKYDGYVCQTIEACMQNPSYNAYLTREYPSPY